MFNAPIQYKEQKWRTSEALFHAMRYDDPKIREMIRIQTSPLVAKNKVKRIEYFAKRVVEPMTSYSEMSGIV